VMVTLLQKRLSLVTSAINVFLGTVDRVPMCCVLVVSIKQRVQNDRTL